VDDLPVSILIVNYNGARHLDACLRALEVQTLPRYRFEVIVVDNSSKDDSLAILRERFPWVRSVPLKQNTGFAEGNNIAAQYAHGRTLVLLNNDTIADPHWLEELLHALSPDGRAASKLVFAHDPTLLNSTGLFLLRDGRGMDRGFRQRDRGQYERTQEVFAGCGAALALPAPPPGEPLLDPRYFVYYEDLDAQWRKRLAGHGPNYAPRSLIRHVHGAAAGDESPLFWFYVERNRALTSLRNGDPFLAVYSALGLGAKAVQAVLRASLGAKGPKGRWPVANAVVRALGSYLWHAPRVLVERFDVRSVPLRRRH